MVLIPLEEWEKVRRDRSGEVNIITVPQIPKNQTNVVKMRQHQRDKGRNIGKSVSHSNRDQMSTAPPTNLLETTVKKKKKKTIPMKTVDLPKTPTLRDRTHLRRRRMTQEGGGMMGKVGLRLNQFPPNIRNNIRKLIRLLKKSRKIGFNTNYEISISGILIPESNIIHLLEHTQSTESIKKSKNNLRGLHRFYIMMRDIGIPTNLIHNKWGLKKMKRKHIKGPGS